MSWPTCAMNVFYLYFDLGVYLGRSAMTPPNLRHFYISKKNHYKSLKAQPICPTSDMPVPIGQNFERLLITFWFLFFYFELFRAFAAKKQHFFLRHFSLFKYNCHLFKGYTFCRQGNNDNLFKQSPLFSCQIVAVLDFFSIQHIVHTQVTYLPLKLLKTNCP